MLRCGSSRVIAPSREALMVLRNAVLCSGRSIDCRPWAVQTRTVGNTADGAATSSTRRQSKQHFPSLNWDSLVNKLPGYQPPPEKKKNNHTPIDKPRSTCEVIKRRSVDTATKATSTREVIKRRSVDTATKTTKQLPFIVATDASHRNTALAPANDRQAAYLLYRYYRQMARGTSTQRLHAIYCLLRPLHLHTYLRRRDLRHLLRCCSKDESISLEELEAILYDMQINGLGPGIPDYQIVMWAAMQRKNWSAAGKIWFKLHSVGHRPDALGYAVMLRVIANDFCWLSREEYLAKSAHEANTGAARQSKADLRFDTHSSQGSSISDLLDRIKADGHFWSPEVWTALVTEHAAQGSLVSLDRLLQTMRHHSIPCSTHATDAIVRRLITLDLKSAVRVALSLPNLSARTLGRLLRACSHAPDLPAFLRVLQCMLKRGIKPERDFIVPLLHSLQSRLRYASMCAAATAETEDNDSYGKVLDLPTFESVDEDAEEVVGTAENTQAWNDIVSTALQDALNDESDPLEVASTFCIDND